MASVAPTKTAGPAAPASGSSSLNASQSSLAQATRSSSMDSLESSMSTTESNAGEVESNRLVTVLQENAVLRSEVEVLRLKCKHLSEENRRWRQASVTIVMAFDLFNDATCSSLWK